MATRKKAVSKKRANEGRPIKCRYCFESMRVELREDGFLATCPRCPHVIDYQAPSHESETVPPYDSSSPGGNG